MARIKTKSMDILSRYKKNGRLKELSLTESALVTTSINKKMRSVKREYNKRESESIHSASRIILTA